VGRHFVPPALRPRLRNFLFSLHSLTFARPSGVRLRIADDTDWALYTELFRKGEYDIAITRALDSAGPGRFSVVDLGANVGFFTLRLIDAVRLRGNRSFDAAITAIEGSPTRVADFRSRVLGDNGLTAQVRVIAGLVGERSGVGTMYEGQFHGDSSLVRRVGSSEQGIEVEFVDVSQLLASEAVIHLLKCDIEGAELQFIRNFPDVLHKTRVAVFELHDDLCDPNTCLRLLREYGFPHECLIRRVGPYSLHCLWR
jgi:FkbM family methyltransferase